MVLIAVTGSASRFLPAERGTVSLSIGFEHADRAVAMRQVGQLHERLVAEAKSHVHRGAATWWGSDQVRAWPQRRYVKDSSEYSIVQAAAAEVKVRFRDFAALSSWAAEAGSVDGVTLAGIDWTVTEQQRLAVQREVQVAAVQDAVRSAEAYASAIGGAGVTLQQLWEPGLRPNTGVAGGDGPMMRSMAAAGGFGDIELRPDDIEIAASLSADFLVLQPETTAPAP